MPDVRLIRICTASGVRYGSICNTRSSASRDACKKNARMLHATTKSPGIRFRKREISVFRVFAAGMEEADADVAEAAFCRVSCRLLSNVARKDSMARLASSGVRPP